MKFFLVLLTVVLTFAVNILAAPMEHVGNAANHLKDQLKTQEIGNVASQIQKMSPFDDMAALPQAIAGHGIPVKRSTKSEIGELTKKESRIRAVIEAKQLIRLTSMFNKQLSDIMVNLEVLQ